MVQKSESIFRKNMSPESKQAQQASEESQQDRGDLENWQGLGACGGQGTCWSIQC